MTLVNEFQPSTNAKKNSIFLCGGGPRYPSVDTVKLGKTLKNMDNVLAKIVKKSIFSKMEIADLLIKKLASFPSKICSVF